MKDASQKIIRLAFLALTGIVIYGMVIGVLAFKNSPYVTKKYAKVRFDHLRYVVEKWRNNGGFTFASLIGIANKKEEEAEKNAMIPILFYQGISKEESAGVIQENKFKEQMNALKAAGFETITLSDIKKAAENKINLPPKPIIIMFGDERKSNYFSTHAVLEALGYKAVILVSGKQVEEGGAFYLSESELRQVIRTGVWEIASRGWNVETLIPISETGEKGSFFGNKMWKEGQLETEEEFKKRIQEDLIKTKQELEKKFEINVVAFGMPNKSFGGHSKNFATAESSVLEVAKEIFGVIVHEYWPKHRDDFRGNSIMDGSKDSVVMKSILMLPNWSVSDAVKVVKSASGTSLPFKETFESEANWIAVSGEVAVKEGKMSIRSREGTAFAYLDGAKQWKDYVARMSVEDVKENSTLTIVGGFKDAKNYIGCQYNKESIFIKKVKDGSEEIIKSIKTTNDYEIKNGINVGIGIKENTVVCLMNSKPALQDDIEERDGLGGVGIKIWNTDGGEVALVVNEIVVDEKPKSAGLIVCDDGNKNCVDRQNVSEETWTRIHRRYESEGRESKVIYDFVSQGELRIADQVMNDIHEVDRFEPVKIENISWQEDPFAEHYWRFGFYSLTSVRHLLFAWEETGNEAYRDKLVSILDSFIDHASYAPYAWDYHVTAFRVMTMVKVWHDLREKNAISEEMSIKILKSLYEHGEFLRDDAHYEGYYNHGVDQAAALYLLSTSMPFLPNAGEWREIARERLKNSVDAIIDSDGILVENSPYYHFYVLEKYWEIEKYLKAYDAELATKYEQTIDKMVAYGTRILAPDQTVPLIGASLEKKVKYAGIYTEIAAKYPELKFVLTSGKLGNKPQDRSVYYPVAGQTLMRSGWGEKNDYEKETQVIFDSGHYRTEHSHLDTLSVDVFGGGIPLLVDAGLYTYELGDYRKHFHGTRGHNTVMVDNLDQLAWEDQVGERKKVVAGQLKQGEEFTYQSAMNELYQGVKHERAVALVRDALILVVDDLLSKDEHTYEQLFHIAPELQSEIQGTAVLARNGNGEIVMKIHQLLPAAIQTTERIRGSENPVRGWCSKEYEVLLPCDEISYTQKAKNAKFVTLIEIGNGKIKNATLDPVENSVVIEEGENKYIIRISKSENVERRVERINSYDESSLRPKVTVLPELLEAKNWIVQQNKGSQTMVENGYDEQGKKILQFKPAKSGGILDARLVQFLDLSDKNIYFEARMRNRKKIKRAEFGLSNENWYWEAEQELGNRSEIYPESYEDQWLPLVFYKAAEREEKLGGWTYNAVGFNWSKVDGVKFRISAEPDEEVVIELRNIGTVSDMKEGVATLIFDDGWKSVLNGLEILERYGVKGNVAVISSVVGKGKYLNLEDLKMLQNKYGWSIANHSNRHKNAIEEYVVKNNLEGLETDILDGLQYLEENGINSAPNWYVYPNGAQSQETRDIVKKYYKFARTTQDLPESYPFEDPLAVKITSVYSHNSTPETIFKAIDDAAKYKNYISIMFHKVEEPVTTYTAYSPEDVERIIKYIVDKGLKVKTLKEVDEDLGVPQSQFKIYPAIPEQITLQYQKW